MPDSDLLAVPAEAAVVLRRMVLCDSTVDEDLKQQTARFLPVHPDELAGMEESDRLRLRIDAKVLELGNMPQHFILNDRIWPRWSESIRSDHTFFFVFDFGF